MKQYPVNSFIGLCKICQKLHLVSKNQLLLHVCCWSCFLTLTLTLTLASWRSHDHHTHVKVVQKCPGSSELKLKEKTKHWIFPLYRSEGCEGLSFLASLVLSTCFIRCSLQENLGFQPAFGLVWQHRSYVLPTCIRTTQRKATELHWCSRVSLEQRLIKHGGGANKTNKSQLNIHKMLVHHIPMQPWGGNTSAQGEWERVRHWLCLRSPGSVLVGPGSPNGHWFWGLRVLGLFEKDLWSRIKMIYLRTDDREVFLVFESGEGRDRESRAEESVGAARGEEEEKKNYV